MRLLRSTLAVFLLFVSSGALGQGRFFIGATGGPSRMSLSGDAPDGATYTSITGFSAGLIGEYALTDDIRLSVQPSYVWRGTGVAFDVGQHDPRDSLELSLGYISIPVMARFLSPQRSWFVNGGLEAGFLHNASLSDVNAGGSVDVKNYVNGMDLMMILGVGGMVKVAPAFLTIELRYTQSLLNAGSSDQLAVAVGVPVRFRSSGFQLLVGVLFPM
jgi:Outer membrane protein beta-barrel domain